MLWYDEPAAKWVEALPVGNGRVSAMVFGGVAEERLQLDEGSRWAGGPYDPVNPEAQAALPEVRRLVNEAEYREAAQLISAKVMAWDQDRIQGHFQDSGEGRPRPLGTIGVSFAAQRIRRFFPRLLRCPGSQRCRGGLRQNPV